MRLMGIDYGFRRIGIAFAESAHGIATPRPAMTASGSLKRDAEALAKMAKTEEADAVVIGLPIEADGGEGRMARICRTLAEHVAAIGPPTHLIDERLTSVQADAHLREEELKASQRRRRKDGEAARLILERFIHEQEVG